MLAINRDCSVNKVFDDAKVIVLNHQLITPKNMQESQTQEEMSITCVTNNGNDASFFSKKNITLNGDDQRMLSEQISAVNFRLRNSGSSYESDWHVAGDPTLLIVLSGCVQIELRNGQCKEFKAGDMFIAQDYLQKGTEFNPSLGHRARVLGDEKIHVLHLKLSKKGGGE